MRWKNIEGYEGLYQVSNTGLVRSLWFGKSKILSPAKNKGGYLKLSLYKNGSSKSFDVHRLVGKAFKINPLGLKHLHHKDHNILNNNSTNLAWVTHRENQSARRNQGASKYVGVVWDSKSKCWKSHIQVRGKKIHLGLFREELAAGRAYRNYIRKNNIQNRYA